MMPFAKKIYIYTKQDPNLTLAKRFFSFNIINDLQTVSFADILFRRIKFVAVPSPQQTRGLIDHIKRKLIKILDLTIQKELEHICLRDLLFQNHGDMTIFVSGQIAYEIYALNCPQMTTIEICNSFGTHSIQEITQEIKAHSSKKNSDTNKGTTVFINPSSFDVLEAYRSIHPNRTIIVRYHDWLGSKKLINNPSIDQTFEKLSLLRKLKIIDSVECYCREDAKKLKALYRPNGVNLKLITSLDASYRNYLIFFSGAETKSSRIKCLEKALKFIIDVYPNVSQRIYIKSAYQNNNRVPYSEYIHETSKAEIYIDLVRLSSSEGFSFRTPEALALNRKIITNRCDIHSEHFYSEDRVFIVGVDKIERLKEFMEKPIHPLNPDILRQYDSSLWWTAYDPYKKQIN